MDQFLERFHQVSDTASGAGFYKGLMTAMIELGAFIGAFNMGWIADRISRKYAIVVASIIFVIGSAIQTAAMDYAMLVVGRLIGGCGAGMMSMIAPLYISEVSPQEIRGSLLVLEQFSIVFGIIISYWITFGTRYMAGEWSYRLPFLLQILPALLLGSAVFLLPFSPRWLASKDRDEECLQSLCRLRQVPRDDPRVQAEWLEIRAEVAFQREVMEKRHPGLVSQRGKGGGLFVAIKLELAGYMECFRHGYAKRTMVGIMVSFFQQFVGINALIYYSPSLFQTMLVDKQPPLMSCSHDRTDFFNLQRGIGYEMRLILAGVLNVTQIVGVVTSFYTMDAWGRRALLLIGSSVMTVCHVVIAVLVGLYYSSWATNVDKGWVSVAFLFIYMLFFGATWGPVPWGKFSSNLPTTYSLCHPLLHRLLIFCAIALPSEIFPSSIRAHGVSWSTCSIVSHPSLSLSLSLST